MTVDAVELRAVEILDDAKDAVWEEFKSLPGWRRAHVYLGGSAHVDAGVTAAAAMLLAKRLVQAEDTGPRALDVNGEPLPFSEEELGRMIEAVESTGRFDVVGRRW